MKLLMEMGAPGRCLNILPTCDVPRAEIPAALLRQTPAELPNVSEVELARHYARMARRAYGVVDGFYPLGSCTMKYNPRVSEEAASLEGFADVHPLQEAASSQGCLRALYEAERALCAITGMDEMTFQPAAGAHGEWTGLKIIRAYHEDRRDAARTEVLVPDSAHGTNPASAAMAGYRVVVVPSDAEGCVDLAALRALAGERTAALMLTNPNTLGVFDKNILEITEIVHAAGGLCYYDGANLNAVMGVVRPGDMGFDVLHLNLHKTFATPHGGGGPGSGPVGVKAFLGDFLPDGQVALTDGAYALTTPEKSIGRVRSFAGNFLVVVKALTYIKMLGRAGIPEAAQAAVLNANYMLKMLESAVPAVPGGHCMHEFVLSLEELKKETGVSALDAAKSLIDRGIHPPTMYFPLIVHEALMFEPTETETRETMDTAIAAFKEILAQARTEATMLHDAPHSTPIGRPDEVGAARNPRVAAERR